jgi:hypothetical protein
MNPSWSQHGVSEHSVSQHGVSEHSVSQHSVSEHSVSQHGVSEQSVSQHSVSQHSVSEHSVSEHSVSEHGVSERPAVTSCFNNTYEMLHVNMYCVTGRSYEVHEKTSQSIPDFSQAHLVEALRYKSECRGFDFRWCYWNFSLT